ncbi:MAG: hypothetical protein OER04_16715, partial [Cyclobacteriaceae bacterium]|nr:hypothetical protein [Cyclobacteriaceae bacterium]
LGHSQAAEALLLGASFAVVATATGGWLSESGIDHHSLTSWVPRSKSGRECRAGDPLIHYQDRQLPRI